MRKTKIICTLGPACRDVKTIEELIKNGMNVVRLNFSHGDHAYHKESIEMIKEIRNRLGIPLSIMLDTKGPEIRLMDFENGSVIIKDGDGFTLTTNDILGNETIAAVTYKNMPSQLSAGDKILIDDGNVELKVESTTDTDIICTVVHGGKISNHKGINVPNVHLDLEYLSEQDKKDVLFGIENDVDYIASSFVRRPEDVIELRKFINYNGGHSIKIISKIESIEGVDNFDRILAKSDGIMVARGDMGVELEYERLPGLQKRFIRKCYKSGKMVITATQMLESMISHPNPTRAEITDVANAVFDGTSAIMLSGETAVGKFPVLALQVMAKIARQAEHDSFMLKSYSTLDYEMDTADTTNAVCDAACTTARDIKAKAIIAVTKYGQTARRMSKFRPFEPIVAATPDVKTFHQLALSWGVYPVLARYQKNSDELFLHAIDCAKQIDLINPGDMVVIAAGVPIDTPGNTNILKIEVVPE